MKHHCIVRRVEGKPWQVQRMAQSLPLHEKQCAMIALHGNGNGFAYAAGAQGLFWFSHDAGASFADFPAAPNDGKITAIGGSQAGELVVAQSGHVNERTPEANTWSELANGAFAASSKIAALAVPAPHHVIAVGDQGVILDISPLPGKP